jgi:hypothetical protein
MFQESLIMLTFAFFAVIPAGNLLLAFAFLAAIQQGICFCLSCCHPRRESAFAFVFLAVIPSGNLLLA